MSKLSLYLRILNDVKMRIFENFGVLEAYFNIQNVLCVNMRIIQAPFDTQNME